LIVLNQPEHKQELMFRVTYSSCTMTVLKRYVSLATPFTVWHVLHIWLLVSHHLCPALQIIASLTDQVIHYL